MSVAQIHVHHVMIAHLQSGSCAEIPLPEYRFCVNLLSDVNFQNGSSAIHVRNFGAVPATNVELSMGTGLVSTITPSVLVYVTISVKNVCPYRMGQDVTGYRFVLEMTKWIHVDQIHVENVFRVAQLVDVDPGTGPAIHVTIVAHLMTENVDVKRRK